MISIKKAHHTSFEVADLEKSKDFYGRILELEPLARPNFRFPGAWFGIGPYQIHLIAAKNPPAKAQATSGTPPSQASHLALEVENLDPIKERLTKEGIPFREGEVVLTHMRQIFAWDPDGNAVEFISLAGS